MKTDNFGSIKRKTIIYIIIITSAVILYGRLFQMQILHRVDYEMKSSDNSIKSLELEPLRGIMYDRNYKVLVSNIPAYTLRITPAYYDTSLNKIIETVIDADPGFIKDLLYKNRGYSKYLAIKVRREINFKTVAWLEENSEHLPGVDYNRNAKVLSCRNYGFSFIRLYKGNITRSA